MSGILLPCDLTLSTGVATVSSLAQLQVPDSEKQRQCRLNDVRLTKSENARSEQLLVMHAESLTDWEWLPGALLSELKCLKAAWFLGMKYQTYFTVDGSAGFLFLAWKLTVQTNRNGKHSNLRTSRPCSKRKAHNRVWKKNIVFWSNRGMCENLRPISEGHKTSGQHTYHDDNTLRESSV